MKPKEHLRALGFALLGLGFACITAFLAALLAGAGHGWMSAIWCSLGVFILPVFGVAFAYQRTRLGETLLRVVAAAMVVIDIIIVGSSQQEGWSYFNKVAERLPLELGVWMSCWTAWQVAVIYLLLRRYGHEVA